MLSNVVGILHPLIHSILKTHLRDRVTLSILPMRKLKLKKNQHCYTVSTSQSKDLCHHQPRYKLQGLSFSCRVIQHYNCLLLHSLKLCFFPTHSIKIYWMLPISQTLFWMLRIKNTGVYNRYSPWSHGGFSWVRICGIHIITWMNV